MVRFLNTSPKFSPCDQMANLVQSAGSNPVVFTGSNPVKGTKQLQYNLENKMLTKSKGDIGEVLVLFEFTKRQVPVYLPFGDNQVCDMIAEFNGKLQKIQVKTATEINNSVRLKLTVRRYEKDHRYTSDEVDYFALVSLPSEKVYLVKNTVDLGNSCFTLRTSGQLIFRSNRAEDFEIEKVLGSFA